MAADLRRRVTLLEGRSLPPGRVVVEATLGCSRELQDLLVEALRDGPEIAARRSNVAGQAAVALTLPRLDSRLTLEVSSQVYRLHLPQLHEERFTLYVAVRTSRPLLAVAALNGHRISARLSLVTKTASLLARARLGRLAQRLDGR